MFLFFFEFLNFTVF